MKGIVFNILEQMVIEKAGLAAWDQLLQDVQPASQGIYTAGGNYPDEEVVQLASRASEMLDIPLNTLVTAFGSYLFSNLVKKHPVFVEQQPDFFSFLKSVHDVIHVEVRKLYEEPSLPHFRYTQLNTQQLRLEYRSPRKLCMLAEGLIAGAAEYYAVRYQLEHPVCMHKGADHCEFLITLEP
ncbi:MAG: heme NO-binding domain-containing protein [Marinobacterium sp.]|nr:heme NO-binding domain-containing protein [Marinobacterium sp.]